ncbi:MAG: hypothetical protein FWG44_05525 [Oscillospiraceae bacterium]|nr:hypothetical protein [Oscillospiraceae bacterium]
MKGFKLRIFALLLMTVVLLSACAEKPMSSDDFEEEEQISEETNETEDEPEIIEEEPETEEPEVVVEEITHEEETVPDPMKYINVSEDGMVEINIKKAYKDFRAVIPTDDGYIKFLYLQNDSIRYRLFDTEELCVVYDADWEETGNEETDLTEACGRYLRHIDGGIYEDKDGELAELLPPVPEELRQTDDISKVYYYFITQIDENRFLYTMGGWEWTWGIGIYNFSTGEYAHLPDTSQLFFRGMSGNYIYLQHQEYGSSTDSIYTLNTDTLEIEKIFNFEQFFGVDEETGYALKYIENFSISPDKKYIVYYYRDSRIEYYSVTVEVVNILNGTIEKTYYFDNLASIEFWDNSKLLLQSLYFAYRDDTIYIIPLDLN